MKYFELNNGVKIPPIGLGINTIGKGRKSVLQKITHKDAKMTGDI